MPLRIEDYALIGNTRTSALVGRDGSIDWMCVPRFDSNACFAALLGSRGNGRWQIAPAQASRGGATRVPGASLILETEFETADGAVRVLDFMPLWDDRCEVVRIVEGVRGRVSMQMELILRFGYGAITPWVRNVDGTLVATSGPDSLELRTRVGVTGRDFTTIAEFTVSEGERVPFVLTWFASHEKRPLPIDAEAALVATERYWRAWVRACTYDGRWGDEVRASLVILKATDLRADRRHGRCRDHVAARVDRRRAELGLPLLLGT